MPANIDTNQNTTKKTRLVLFSLVQDLEIIISADKNETLSTPQARGKSLVYGLDGKKRNRLGCLDSWP